MVIAIATATFGAGMWDAEFVVERKINRIRLLSCHIMLLQDYGGNVDENSSTAADTPVSRDMDMNETSPADHGPLSFEATLAKSFSLRDVPTLRAGVATVAPPVLFSRLTNERPQPGRSLAPKLEEAFIFQVPLIANPDPDIRYSGKPTARSADAGKPGWSCLLDLRNGPTRRLDTTFDNMRLYISQRTIDEFVYQKGRRRIYGLVQQGFGEWDAVLFHFSQTLMSILKRPGEVNTLLVDALAIAFCEHVVARYGASVASGRDQRPRLAPWQMQRIIDFFEANLNGNPSILDLASQCDLSASYFAEAFKQTAGISPHQWLLRRRIVRAKSLLSGTDASLAAIAADCGFFDQSHFSRVFVRLVGCRPKDWRLHNRAR